VIEVLIASLLAIDISFLVVVIDRIVKAYQPNMTEEQEEENLGRYESQDRYESGEHREHQRGWEFKILRTSGNGFRHPKALQKVCAEEAESGWILLEKLDDRRLRFRRPVMAREHDHLAKIDPYRAYYGISSELAAAISVTILIIVLAIPTYLGFSLMQNIFKSTSTKNLQSAPKLTTPKVTPLPSAKATNTPKK